MARRGTQVAATPPDDVPDAEGPGSVRVLERAMRVLKCLADQPEDATLTEISRDVGLHKSTVLRFLKTLEQGGFVAPSGNGKGWCLGPTFVDFGMRALGRQDLRTVARPFMEEACRQSGETVQLAILDGDGIVYIEKIEPPDIPLRINTQIGTRRPVHCTALGKLMLAYRERRDVDRVVQAGMPRFTPRTITSASELLEALARIRQRGYAVDDHEFNELVCCTAAPIRDGGGRVVAGVSVSTFAIAVDSARFGQLIEAAVATAERISLALGWHRATPPAEKAL